MSESKTEEKPQVTPTAPAVEPKPTETPNPATPTTPTPPTPPVAPTLDTDAANKLKEDISKDVTESVSNTVSQSIVERIGKALGLSKEEAKEELPKDPKELESFINKKVQEQLQAEKDDQESQTAETEKQRQERIDSIITDWHSQYESLSSMGKVPKVEDANNTNDKGLQSRKKLIQQIGKMIDENKKSGIEYTPTVQDALLANPSILSGVPGADLPISGSTASRENSRAFSNKEIRGKSFLEIAADSAT